MPGIEMLGYLIRIFELITFFCAVADVLETHRKGKQVLNMISQQPD